MLARQWVSTLALMYGHERRIGTVHSTYWGVNPNRGDRSATGHPEIDGRFRNEYRRAWPGCCRMGAPVVPGCQPLFSPKVVLRCQPLFFSKKFRRITQLARPSFDGRT